MHVFYLSNVRSRTVVAQQSSLVVGVMLVPITIHLHSVSSERQKLEIGLATGPVLPNKHVLASCNVKTLRDVQGDLNRVF